MYPEDPTGPADHTPDHTPAELSYPGLSPQVLARVHQLWSAAGLDHDRHWREAVRGLPGFRALPRDSWRISSADVDLVFLFDQCVIYVRALHEAADAGRAQGIGGLSPAQWQGLTALTARLTEQMAALRLLALTDLPMPAMQIARSVSEDVDMALVILIRRNLAQKFADCRNVEDAREFWRRHIAGGRAFRTVSERLYAVGIDHSADTEYARWRETVLTTLGAAIHSNALTKRFDPSRPGQTLMNADSLHFATFRIHEFCAYSQLVRPELIRALTRAGAAAQHDGARQLATLAGPLSRILIDQIPSLSQPGTDEIRTEASPL